MANAEGSRRPKSLENLVMEARDAGSPPACGGGVANKAVVMISLLNLTTHSQLSELEEEKNQKTSVPSTGEDVLLGVPLRAFLDRPVPYLAGDDDDR